MDEDLSSNILKYAFVAIIGSVIQAIYPLFFVDNASYTALWLYYITINFISISHYYLNKKENDLSLYTVIIMDIIYALSFIRVIYVLDYFGKLFYVMTHVTILLALTIIYVGDFNIVKDRIPKHLYLLIINFFLMSLLGFVYLMESTVIKLEFLFLIIYIVFNLVNFIIYYFNAFILKILKYVSFFIVLFNAIASGYVLLFVLEDFNIALMVGVVFLQLALLLAQFIWILDSPSSAS